MKMGSLISCLSPLLLKKVNQRQIPLPNLPHLKVPRTHKYALSIRDEVYIFIFLFAHLSAKELIMYGTYLLMELTFYSHVFISSSYWYSGDQGF